MHTGKCFELLGGLKTDEFPCGIFKIYQFNVGEVYRCGNCVDSVEIVSENLANEGVKSEFV